VCTGSKAGAAADTEHKVVFMGVATGVEHEAASMGEQQAQSMNLHPWAWSTRRSEAQGCIHRRHEGIIIENKRATARGRLDVRALVSPIPLAIVDQDKRERVAF
jgi:hypothetical protein